MPDQLAFRAVNVHGRLIELPERQSIRVSPVTQPSCSSVFFFPYAGLKLVEVSLSVATCGRKDSLRPRSSANLWVSGCEASLGHGAAAAVLSPHKTSKVTTPTCAEPLTSSIRLLIFSRPKIRAGRAVWTSSKVGKRG